MLLQDMALTAAFTVGALTLWCLPGAAQQQTDIPRETVLDEIAHLQQELFEVPAVPPLCNLLPRLTKRRINVGNARLYVEEEGQGMPIVLLHGGPECTHQYFHPSFSRLATFARVIYYDRRGCGQSSYTPGPAGYTVDQAVDDLEHLRKALEISRWIVLGHSFGGFLAQWYAVKYPDHLAALILADAMPPYSVDHQLQPTRQQMFITSEEKQRIHEIHNTRGISISNKIYNAWLNGDWKRQNFYRPTNDEMTRMARHGCMYDDGYGSHMMCSYPTYSLCGAFERCPIPTLIIEGKWDLTWNIDKPEKMRQLLPKAQLILFERSGHSPFDDQPEIFTQCIHNFLLNLPTLNRADISRWKRSLRMLRLRDHHFLNSQNEQWRKDAHILAGNYSATWLAESHDASQLCAMGLALFEENRFEDSLMAFHAVKPDRPDDDEYYLIALVWQGHIFDLLHRRGEALKYYRQALQRYRGEESQHTQYRIVIDHRWIKTRIKSSFKLGDHNMPL